MYLFTAWGPYRSRHLSPEDCPDHIEKVMYLPDEGAIGDIELRKRKRSQPSIRRFSCLTVIKILLPTISVLLNGPHLLPKGSCTGNIAAKARFFYCKPSITHRRSMGLTVLTPLTETTPIASRTTHLNGTLFPPPNPSFSRMEPRVKADKAWDFCEHQAPNVFSITHADALVLGKDPETVAQFPNEIFGKGQTHT